MTKSKVAAVLIVGENRNGTTWLGNLLRDKFGLFSPSHPLHFGCLEVNLFSLNQRWENIRSKSDYEEFLKDYSQSDLFSILEGDVESLRDKNQFPSFYHFFLFLLQSYLKTHPHPAWALKLEPRHIAHSADLKEFLRLVEAGFGPLKIIVIQREFEGYFNSAKTLFGKAVRKNKIHRFGFVSSMIIAARYGFLYRICVGRLPKCDVIQLRYEDLLSNRTDSLSRIADLTGLKFNSRQPTVEAEQNSSSALTKKRHSSRIAKLVSNSGFLSWLIVGTLERVRRIFGIETTNVYYRIRMAKESPAELKKQFENTAEEKLIKYIDKVYES